MIISIDEIIKMPEFKGADAADVQQKLDALECLVRKHTNNKFQNTNIRFEASCADGIIYGVHPFLRVGDTVEVSESGVNDGLYVIKGINSSITTVDSELFPVAHNLITKIYYPSAIKDGVKELMKWEYTMRNKVGVKSETISRHSVTYYDQDANNQVDGYPVSLLGFLNPYMKARF